MEKKRNRLFTSEDRQKVFQKIRNQESEKSRPKPFIPAVIIVAMIIISAVLLSNFIKPQQQGAEVDAIQQNEKATFKTILVSMKDSTERVPVNVVFALDDENKLIHAMALPRDTKVQIATEVEGELITDKLTFAYRLGNAGEANLQQTVENLLAISIDEVIVVDLKDFVKNVGMVEYTLAEPLTVRAIEQAKFELSGGKQFLDGEQLASMFVMATTNYFDLTEKQAITKLFLRELIQSTPTLNPLLQYNLDIVPVMDDLQLEGVNTEVIDQKFYYTFSDEVVKEMIEMLYDF